MVLEEIESAPDIADVELISNSSRKWRIAR